MPVYEYQCSECRHIEEAFQKISAPPLAVCPQCRGPLSKIISHSAFHLKGSGWYVTDYGGTKPKTDAAEKPAAESAKTASAATSDTAKKEAAK